MKFGPVLLALAALFSSTAARAEGFLKVQGTRIVDDSGQPVILRGMGLGGWMLQEGYMLKLGEVGQQHRIRARLAELVGEERTAEFYRTWLDNHTTEADIAQMAAWGFNSVRLPIHFDQLTLPADKEPMPGRDTWHEEGFQRIDRLLEWCRKHRLYLILDLHAAPGGQGNDLAISDRDPAKPSLWESAENQRKTVALWTRLAARYKDEPWIGGYDLINEPNWSFATPGKGNGCNETENTAVWDLQRRITDAIRSVDTHHIVIVEGNCWGNNYKGLPCGVGRQYGAEFPQILEPQQCGEHRRHCGAAFALQPARVARRVGREQQCLVSRCHRAGRGRRHRLEFLAAEEDRLQPAAGDRRGRRLDEDRRLGDRQGAEAQSRRGLRRDDAAGGEQPFRPQHSQARRNRRDGPPAARSGAPPLRRPSAGDRAADDPRRRL
ncbi:glycoside hydrolase family 5 protein [Sphingopyxis sp. PET50]|uniref:glycoside hydrolase family 5 protein n=1 Tax=Sphingopyxis sp. PET50 TaxID=2976533 RepID=UPI0021AFEB53|nr:cellulase family glycosylhydrolase [Sphingopyxis sp. PET50]